MISVILTTYNSEKYIERSLKSILKQSRFDLIHEILLIDDESNDKTLEIAKNIFRDIKVFNKKNSGPASSRNLGIKNSECKLICFLDADDFWHKDKIKNQYEAYIKNPMFDIFVCNLISVSGKNEIGVRYNKEKIFEDKNINHGEVTKYIKSGGRYSFHPPSSLMVKKNLFQKYGYFNETLISVEDSEIFLRWVINNCKIYFDSRPLGYYETENQNSLTKNLDLWCSNNFKYWFLIDTSKLSISLRKDFILMRRNSLLDSILTIIKRGNKILAFRTLIKNFKILQSFRFYIIFIILFFPIHSLRKLNDIFFRKNKN